jgi:hypothetical protein
MPWYARPAVMRRQARVTTRQAATLVCRCSAVGVGGVGFVAAVSTRMPSKTAGSRGATHAVEGERGGPIKWRNEASLMPATSAPASPWSTVSAPGVDGRRQSAATAYSHPRLAVVPQRPVVLPGSTPTGTVFSRMTRNRHSTRTPHDGQDALLQAPCGGASSCRMAWATARASSKSGSVTGQPKW